MFLFSFLNHCMHEKIYYNIDGAKNMLAMDLQFGDTKFWRESENMLTASLSVSEEK